MNFTREPIIETIITAREGSRLVVRSSKSEGQEEYSVEAVEVVSFGQALFFRSMEKPRAFLVPVSDYEVVEAKESRAVLKHAQFDRTIKIGGGREAPVRREAPEADDEEEAAPAHLEEEEPATDQRSGDRRRDRRRNRRRRPQDERDEPRVEASPSEEKSSESAKPQESSAAVFTTLIPPPSTLISDTIGRYKDMMPQEKPPVEQPKKEEKSVEEGEENTLSRVMEKQQTFSPPPFSPPTDWSHFLS